MMNYQSRIDKLTHDYVSSFKNQSPEVLNHRPNSKDWSINQIVDHVNKLNRSYFPIFEEISKGKFATPFIGNFRFFANYMGQKIMQSVDIKNSKKTKTTSIWRPRKVTQEEEIFSDFVETQDRLKEYIDKMEKFIKRDIVIHSPASKSIVYPISQALDIIIMHEVRHYHQAQKLLPTV